MCPDFSLFLGYIRLLKFQFNFQIYRSQLGEVIEESVAAFIAYDVDTTDILDIHNYTVNLTGEFQLVPMDQITILNLMQCDSNKVI